MEKDFRQIESAVSFREVSLTRSFETFTPSFEDVFERWWSNFEHLSRPKGEKLESLTVDIPLTEEEAVAGGTMRVLVPTLVTCQSCHGHGGIGLYECWHCQGQGAIIAECPLEVSYPAMLRGDYVVRVPLEDFGIQNLYLTARFRPSEIMATQAAATL
jgi:molecular chaperone DnaJ